MENIVLYIIRVSAAVLLFYAFHQIVLRHTTFYRINRFFLLGSLLFSFVFPLIPLAGGDAITPLPLARMLDGVTVYAGMPVGTDKTSPSLFLLTVLILYFTGVVVLLLLFGQNLIRIFRLRSRSEKVIINGVKVYIVDRTLSSFSFGRWIFVDLENYRSDTDRIVLKHELVHVRQHHSIDLVFMELVRAVLWFHPFIWLYKRLFAEVHEYLADAVVINQGTEAGRYMQLLFQQSCDIHPVAVSNHFNQSLIKRRFTMISRAKSGSMSAITVAIGLPLVTLACFFLIKVLSLPVTAQQQKTVAGVEVRNNSGNPQSDPSEEVFKKVDKMAEYPGGNEALTAHIVKEIKYPGLAKKWGIEGKVYVSFVVNSKGKMMKFEVLKTTGSYASPDAKKAPADVYKQALTDMEAEALRVLKSVPGTWKPAQAANKNVAVNFTMPISFKLN